MTTAAKFPTAAVTLADLGGEMPGFPELVLSGAHDAATATFTFTTAVPAYWPTVGWFAVDTEIISYTGKSGSTVTGCVRGAQSTYSGSVAATHASGAKAAPYLTPQAVNQIMAEIIALETQLLSSIDVPTLRYWYWASSMTIVATLTGTGAYTAAASGGFATLSTGATSGSNVSLQMPMGIFNTGNAGTFEIREWGFGFATDKAASEAWRLFLSNETGTTQPSLTARHLGIRFDGTTAYFSTADGTTEQTTDITANITASTTHYGMVTFDGTTAKLYLDGTLRATHATNVPTTEAVFPTMRAHITNSAAADKLFYLNQMHARTVA